jgi:hypothetical protein
MCRQQSLSIRIDGTTYQHDVVIDLGEIRERKEKPSKKFRDDAGHIPLSIEERSLGSVSSLVIGTGTGAMPVMDEVKQDDRHRKVELRILPTAQAIELLKMAPSGSNAILHVI